MKTPLATLCWFFISIGLSMGMALANEPVLKKAREVASADGVSEKEIETGIKAAMWKKDLSAVAFSFHRPKGSLCILIIRQPTGDYNVVKINHAESANFGRLGFGRDHYERFRSKPLRWEDRDDVFYLIYQTQAWRKGQRYTVRSPIVVTLAGKRLHQ